MKADGPIFFPPFRVDLVEQRLYRASVIPLRPKTYAVLRYLLEHAGKTVSKNELLDAVWPDTVVGDSVLKVSINELREKLGDDAESPRFILTEARKGYRFIGAIRRSNLPAQLTSFVGREREIEEVSRRLASTRLLTLTGPGGSGKTRLAVEVANVLVETQGEEVWWVELASLADESLVPQAIASALGVHEQPGRTLTQTVCEHLRSARLTLVLDNCEHLIESCATLAVALLRSCPTLRILATSREALGVKGETPWLIPPLSLPDRRRLPPARGLEQYAALQLFEERGRAALPGFVLTERDTEAASQVCIRLDGLPLAIELAAARLKVLTVQQIAARLDDCFRLLTTGGRTELPRHQTLGAAIDWSYDLLTVKEQTLVRRLSIFAGGWTLQAAEAICADDDIGLVEILDLLSHLVDKSLVASGAEGAAEARHRLLETIRQYALQKSAGSGDAASVHRRHANYYLRLAEEIAPKINTAERGIWLARLEVEVDNMRAALHSLADDGVAEAEVRLCHALFYFWLYNGHWSEGRRRLRDALEHAEVGSRARGIAMGDGGMLAYIMGDHPAARALLSESAAIHRRIGHRLDLSRALRFLCYEVMEDEPALARAMGEESVAICREEGGSQFDLAMTISNLGMLAQVQGDVDAAREHLLESVALCRELGDKWAIALPLRSLAILALQHGDYQQAAACARESLSGQSDSNEKWFISRSLDAIAMVVSAQGQYRRAARLFGAAEALREAVGASPRTIYRGEYESRMATARAALGAEGFCAAWTAGRAMTVEEAIAHGLAEST